MEPLRSVASDEDGLQDQRQQRVTDSRFLPMQANSPHLDFQDSNLSPALSLLPSNSLQDPNFSEYSLCHQTDTEFAPLSAYPDISMASENIHVEPLEVTTKTLDQASLSQHPLAEEEENNCSSLSQHSLSPEHDVQKVEMLHSLVASITDKKGQQIASKVTISGNLEKVEDTYFLSKDVPAEHLMQILQKDVGVLSSSCSTSCSSNTSAKKEPKSTYNPYPDQSLIREGPPGEASASQQLQTKKESNIIETKTPLTDAFNVSVGSRSTKPDDSSEALRQELLLEAQRRSSLEGRQEQKNAKTPEEFATPFPTERKPILAKENISSASWAGPFSTGVQQRLREHDLWSSGNQTSIDGSYLGFLPQSQSTPGVFKAPTKSSIKSKFQQLSDIESNKESSVQSSAEISPSPAADPQSETKTQREEEPTCDKVHSLPSLNYMQKVDAWRANQTSGKTSLFDSLALQGFTGVSPKKKAYEAVSDSLNRILSQQVVKMTQNPPNPSIDLSSTSSPRREEAVGSAPSDKDNTAATQPTSPFNRSQSHSSLSTVVMSVKKEQTAEARIEKDNIEEAEVQLHPSIVGHLSPLVVSLGQFSDVTLSNSQDSSNSGQKVATSIGTSSVSLEVDNYDPYWTAKLSTPPPQYKPRELNIEERIPVYLQNLGIDQSPSMILTPFAPRGPIREPEFSPTELCTIKGSTPTKSIQPSEGGTPHKAEFSRSSLQSVDSSVSIPLSTDGQVIGQELFRQSSSSSDTSAAIQSARKLHLSPIEDASSQQQQEGSESPVYSGPLLDQDKNKALESHQVGPKAEQNAEISLVSSGAFSDIRKLLSQAEDMASPRSSAASDQCFPQRKEASFTSAFTTEESRPETSHQWTRSSSDSVLTTRERLTGGENIPLIPAKQSGVVSRSSGVSLVLNKSVQRAEPEGCSAAPPDRIPTQPQVKSPPTPSSLAVIVPEEPQETSQLGPIQSSTSSSPLPADAMSDRSSESSLAIRVAKLLQTESPATMVSSVTSVDQDEGKAREWIIQMISGQKCEPLELDKEDRRRIEEIKRELLLKNPKLGYVSTDTESSAASSLRDPRGSTQLQTIEILPKSLDSKKPLSQHSGNLSTNVSQPHSTEQQDIAARVQEIAAREGVNLKTRALTSITISTCRRSTSPSPSTSPAPPVSPTTEPLNINQLRTEEDGIKQLSPTVSQEEFSEQTQKDVALNRETQKSHSEVRQDTVGQYEESYSSSVSLEQDKIKARHLDFVKKEQRLDNTKALFKAKEVTTKSGHISQVRLTLSPKPLDHASDNSPIFSRDLSFPQKHFVPLRHSPSTPSSPDEGVGLSSPPEWHEVPRRSQKIETNKPFIQEPQRVTSSIHVSPKPVAVEATVPHLLPYKPHGSEELFYVPQTEADSSTDTTMESTHTGSDDALPPSFSSDVLGQQDPGLARGVTLRHAEGIYSKRSTKPRITMTEQGLRASPDTVNEASPANISQTPKSTTAAAFSNVPLTRIADVPTMSRRDQGTSPGPHITQEPQAFDTNKLQIENSVQFEADSQLSDHLQPHQDILLPTSQRNISTLDQLWQRFTQRWSQEESRPVSDREVSLLERLERLSHLIHSTRGSTVSEIETSQQELYAQQKQQQTRDFRELRKQISADKNHMRKTSEKKYRQDFGILTTQAEEDSHLFSPAGREASDTLSTTSLSTVDTARLVRAFGADRVQRNLKTSSSSLSKLYTAISKQKEQGHNEKTKFRDTLLTPSETSGTDESSVVDSASSTSTYTLPPHHGPSKTLVSKKAVKLVSKGIQAGDLEIVSNGTRRHTRDVGMTFPSPIDTRGARPSSSSSNQHSPLSKTQKHRKGQKSPSKRYPEAVSWFISADELKTEAWKENEPEQDWRPSSVWFEPFSKKHSWREPLRQRQVEEERNTHQSYVSDSHLGRKKPSSLVQASLQDALLVGRPDFVSRSRQRLERLAMQVEERRLQALFSHEQDELFSRPRELGRLPRPAGAAQVRRAVPRKEMIQRSKQIYENLPEVRRRKEEERRKAEYRSYRLNAQLYNKRITNRVLGRRTVWH